MIRLAVALFAFGLLAYPVWGLVSPEEYRSQLEDFHGTAEATASQLQMAAGIHWLRNAYLAFAFLLLARFIGRPGQTGDVRRAGALLVGFPIVELLYQALAQVAMSPDTEDLNMHIQISTHLAMYCVLGLCLVGIARVVEAPADKDAATRRPGSDG
jgi:hypothetical protein